MMTRRERLERKLEKRREWADKARGAAASAFRRADSAVAGIPMGQPILVGHHSERRHRAALERSDNAMRAGCERQDMAAHHSSKAEGLESALDNSVFSDDPDAIDAIKARIAENETKRDRMKLVNKLYAKGDADGLAKLGLNLDALKVSVAGNFSWDKRPYASYSLTNLGARIRTDKKRIEEIQRRQIRTEAADKAPGGVLIEGTDYVRVTFAEKPARPLINALKEADFYWGAGCWHGYRAKLPLEVAALTQDECEGRTIWNSDGTDGPALICAPPEGGDK